MIRTAAFLPEGWFWHWQAEDEDRPWRYSRAWFHFGGKVGRCLAIEWCWFGSLRKLGLTLSTGGDEQDVQLSVGLWLVTVYVTLSGLLPRHWLHRGWERSTGAALWSGGHIEVEWRHESICWPPEHGWRWSLDIPDFLLGRHVYTDETLKIVETVVPMPEKTYPCTVRLHRSRWRRPRWPVTKVVYRATVDVPGGIPHPGKGTTSYNCEDDALYGQTAPARTVPEAVGRVVSTVLDYRERYPL